jgi:hypothetical protein
MTLADLRATIERLPVFDRGNGPDEGDPDRYTVRLARVLELITGPGPDSEVIRARNAVLSAAGNHEVMHRRGESCPICKAVLRYRAARTEARS